MGSNPIAPTTEGLFIATNLLFFLPKIKKNVQMFGSFKKTPYLCTRVKKQTSLTTNNNEKMRTKKYKKLTHDSIIVDGHKLYRIQALVDFSNVMCGDIGGYIESEKNLSHDGNCWVYNNAKVFGNAQVCDDAIVFDSAKICDDAVVCISAVVSDYAKICGNAQIYDKSIVRDYAKVSGNARIFADAIVRGHSVIFGNAVVSDYAVISNNAEVSGNGAVYGNASVYNHAMIRDDAVVCDTAIVNGNTEVSGRARICGNAVISSDSDYIVFKNHWSSGRYFTWTKSNNMWSVGCFYGSGAELIKKAYIDSQESGQNYEKYVKFVEALNR